MKTTLEELCPDIWHQIFEYFDPIELFYSLVHVTIAADEVLFDKNHHVRFRRLVVDVYVKILPEKLPLNQIISLELHQESCLDIIEQCSEVRSLKLTGQSSWVISLLRKISYSNMKLEQLVLVVSGIGSLYDLLECVASLFSLHRLSIHANESDEKIKTRNLSVRSTKIEQFSLHACSSMSWNELAHMVPVLFNICFLDLTLFHNNKDPFCWFTFPKLRYIRLTLLEVPFEWIIQIVKTMPSLIKLKLNGLIDAEGFAINNRWFELFESCFSLSTVIVNLSLEKDANYFCIDTIQTSLREVNLSLTRIEDDYDYYSDGRNQQRWWTLSGIIIK
jgi:hypothetical protein